MPNSQISLFAPPVYLNGAAPAVTAPAVFGASAGLPFASCLFPQPRYDVVPYPIGTGRCSVVCRVDGLRDGFDFEFPIDAPEALPYGGVRSVGHWLGRTSAHGYSSSACFRG